MPREVFHVKRGDTREPLELQFTLEKKGVPPDQWPPMDCTDATGLRFIMRPAGWPDLVLAMPPPQQFAAIPETGEGELASGLYYYRVAPLRSQGSNQIYEEAAPTQEELVTLIGPGRIALGWRPPEAASAFRVYRSTTPGGPYMTFLADQPRFVDTGITTGTPGTPIGPKVAAEAEWVSKADGIARYRWQPDDIDTPGNWDAEMEATFPGGDRATAPNDDYLLVCVLPDLG
jgi:hypothetical protein